MKKITKCMLFAFALLVGFTVKANAVSAATLHQENTSYYYDRFYADGSEHSWYFKHYTMDNEVAYCIEPGVHEGTTYPQTNYEATGLPDSIKERILLIGYYGYTYPGHQTEQYHMATQGMLWDTIIGVGDNTRFSTARYGQGTMVDITAERNEIKRLIDHHFDVPSFNGNVYKLQVGESLTITDTNNLLSEFDISVSGANYNINGNDITIVPTQSGKIDVSFTKKMPYSKSYKIFTGNGIQNMLVPGMVDPVIAKIRINSYTSPVEFEKLDVETNSNTPQGQATLKGAKYGVYEQATGNQVATMTTDENGYAISEPILEYKEYYIQEISPSEGYLLDNTKYNFDMRGKESEKITVFEKVVKNYVSILKQYDYVDGNTTFLNAESGIQFEIYYPNGNLFDTITTDKNGYATINLPYGVWKFHQVNTTTGFEKIYDFFITVNYDSESEQYYNILNNALSSFLQVFKIDSATGKSIALADTTFKIFNKDKNQYVSQFVGGKVYSEFKTDETGKFTTYLKLESGNYKLIETSSPKGYLLAKDGVDFTIGNDTHFSYTTYGPIITMYFNNTPIRGKIEIHKSGELFAAENETFNYNGRTSLKDIVYTIYADEDIKSSDGQYLYYEKDQFVGTMSTDKDGYAVSEALPLGKYRVQEAQTKDDYLLDKTIYYIELTEIDNKTEVVYSSHDMLNILKKGNVEFNKTDFVDNEAIPNVLMELYTENNELIFKGRTDDTGKITIKNLKLGRYYFLEKEAPNGYLLNNEKLWFEIKEDGEVVKAEMKDERVIGIINIHKDGEKYSITESCENNDSCFVYETERNLKGVHFGLYASDDIVLNNKTRYSKNDLVADGYTDENGNLTFGNLYLGNYIIKELDTIDRYVLDKKEYKVSLEYIDSKTASIEKSFVLKNYLIKSDLEFTKTDLVDDTPLPNTLIEIYVDNSENENEDLLVFSGYTDENGKITIKDMPTNKYYLLEVEAPEGYVLNEEPMYFEIKEDGEVVKAEMKDEKIKSTIVIHKLSDENETLAGVKIGIFDLDGNLLYECYTDEFGNIEIELEYGKYYYQELETIDGYELNDEKIYFEVIDNEAIIETSLINIKVPITGVKDYYIIAQIIGSLIIFTGIGVMIYANKKRKK